MTQWMWLILAFIAGWLIGLTTSVHIIHPIITSVVKSTYDKFYDKALSEALKRLGNNKKTK